MDVQIDHRVPTSYAWEHGAATWTRDRRREFYNDHTNLAATAQAVNRDKWHQSPADWRPSLTSARCAYATGWVTTIDTWDLTLDARDRRALNATLIQC